MPAQVKTPAVSRGLRRSSRSWRRPWRNTPQSRELPFWHAVRIGVRSTNSSTVPSLTSVASETASKKLGLAIGRLRPSPPFSKVSPRRDRTRASRGHHGVWRGQNNSPSLSSRSRIARGLRRSTPPRLMLHRRNLLGGGDGEAEAAHWPAWRLYDRRAAVVSLPPAKPTDSVRPGSIAPGVDAPVARTSFGHPTPSVGPST